jgi:AcrR family transcriptional regulator
MTKQKTQKTDRLTREQWLARSLEILSDGGPGELRIDNITHKMGISKGSFYWHFKNRADYIECLALVKRCSCRTSQYNGFRPCFKNEVTY